MDDFRVEVDRCLDMREQNKRKAQAACDINLLAIYPTVDWVSRDYYNGIIELCGCAVIWNEIIGLP